MANNWKQKESSKGYKSDLTFLFLKNSYFSLLIKKINLKSDHNPNIYCLYSYFLNKNWQTFILLNYNLKLILSIISL